MPHDFPKLSATFQPRVEVQPHQDGAGTYHSHCQSITFVDPYQDISFEELRLSDYTLGAQSMSVSSERTAQHLRRDRNSIMRIDSPIVRVRVSNDASDQHEFSIHQDILIRNSEFFKAAVKEEWLSEKAGEHFRVIEMPDDDPNIFSIYADWLYSGLICSATEHSGKGNDTEFEDLTLAYILGEKLLDKSFKNAVIDAFIEKLISERVLDLELPKLIYDNTRPTSPFRRLLVDIYAHHADSSWMMRSSAKDHLHPSFLYDLSLAQLSNLTLKTETPAYIQSKCIYHEHEGMLQKCTRNNGVKVYHSGQI
ncbi:hypothetical protein BDV97DRAFT_389858 [Delphinella strobiligena]|nr:hypothetical protein BDV97DRAFT_389858 [Delphinella strobiligena]